MATVTQPEDGALGAAGDADAEPGDETKGARTRRRLVEIAVARFGDQGYRQTSVSEVAREAGLTQAAVYAYFDSKEALFDAAVDADAEAAIAHAGDALTAVPATQLVPLLLIQLLGSLDQYPLLKRVLGGQEPDALRRLVNLPALGQLTTAIAERVREGQARGEVRPDIDPVAFADGSETIVLSLLMSIVQVGASTEARRQLGVLAIFDSVLRVPAVPVAVA